MDREGGCSNNSAPAISDNRVINLNDTENSYTQTE